MNVRIITSATINKPIKKVFDHIISIDLSHIFRKYKYLPAVIKTDEKEKWVKSGLARTVFFEDRNTAFEELLVVKNPDYFAYKVSNFTSVLKYLVTQINGSWQFTAQQNKLTKIVWEYELVPKNKFASWLVKNFLYKDVSKLCKNAMQIIYKDLEK